LGQLLLQHFPKVVLDFIKDKNTYLIEPIEWTTKSPLL